MRSKFPEKLERARIRNGYYASRRGDTFGAFKFIGPCGRELVIVAADGNDDMAQGWDHVSVSTRTRTPNWTEMAAAKDLFFDEEECVVQFHPPKSVYVNNFSNCLHLWKPPQAVVLPPLWMVGVKDASEVKDAPAVRALMEKLEAEAAQLPDPAA